MDLDGAGKVVRPSVASSPGARVCPDRRRQHRPLGHLTTFSSSSESRLIPQNGQNRILRDNERGLLE
jgi:hypothetical protein